MDTEALIPIQNIMGRLTKAHRQAWASPQQAVKWLLRFSNADLSTLSQDEMVELIFQVHAFGEWGLPITIGRRRDTIPFLIEANGGDFWGKDGVPSGLTVRRLRILQAQLQECLRGLRLDGSTAIPLPATTMNVVAIPKAPGSKFDSRCLLTLEHEQDDAGFWFNVAFLLGCFGGLIRPCRRCQNLYCAERERQAYCGHACQNAAVQDRHRKRVREKKRLKSKGGGKNRVTRETRSSDC